MISTVISSKLLKHLHSRQKNKLHLTKSWGAQKHGQPWTLKSGGGGSSLGALQKFTPMTMSALYKQYRKCVEQYNQLRRSYIEGVKAAWCEAVVSAQTELHQSRNLQQ